MQVSFERSGGVLKVAGPLDISVAGEFRDALRSWMAAESDLRLDLSRVDSCDTAILQVFHSARKSASQLGKPFLLLAVSAAVVEMHAALGLSMEEPAAREGPDAP